MQVHLGPKASEMLQKTLDEVVESDLKRYGYTKLIGPHTRDALKMAVDKDKLVELNNKLIDRWWEWLKGNEQRDPKNWEEHKKGWFPRLERLRL
jgi:hypothetical protein